MKILSVFAAILFFSFSSFAQNASLNYGCALKLYNNASYEWGKTVTFPDNSVNSTTQTSRNLCLVRPSVAIQWRTKRSNFHEIEISGLQRCRTKDETIVRDSADHVSVLTAGAVTIQSSLGMRYEFMKAFRKNKDKKWVPFIGLSATASVSRTRYKPEVSSSYPEKSLAFSSGFFIVPRICRYTAKKIFFNFDVPYCIVEGDFEKTETITNATPVPAWTTNWKSGFTTFPKRISFRAGIGIKI